MHKALHLISICKRPRLPLLTGCLIWGRDTQFYMAWIHVYSTDLQRYHLTLNWEFNISIMVIERSRENYSSSKRLSAELEGCRTLVHEASIPASSRARNLLLHVEMWTRTEQHCGLGDLAACRGQRWHLMDSGFPQAIPTRCLVAVCRATLWT
ncbi:hypothetical protein C0J52_08111 [Blattella germanica]|nr:hypothetical protein C0J52_08111 [Blattella germanica]